MTCKSLLLFLLTISSNPIVVQTPKEISVERDTGYLAMTPISEIKHDTVYMVVKQPEKVEP